MLTTSLQSTSQWYLFCNRRTVARWPPLAAFIRAFIPVYTYAYIYTQKQTQPEVLRHWQADTHRVNVLMQVLHKNGGQLHKCACTVYTNVYCSTVKCQVSRKYKLLKVAGQWMSMTVWSAKTDLLCVNGSPCYEYLVGAVYVATICGICIYTHTEFVYHACTHFIPVWSRAVVPLYEDLNQFTVSTLGSCYHWSVTLATHKKTKWTFLDEHNILALSAQPALLVGCKTEHAAIKPLKQAVLPLGCSSRRKRKPASHSEYLMP